MKGETREYGGKRDKSEGKELEGKVEESRLRNSIRMRLEMKAGGNDKRKWNKLRERRE
jgi:hypothetical protein